MVVTINSLLNKHRESRTFGAEKLEFTGVGTKDVYNITAPFDLKGQMILAGRVEARESEHSEIGFFKETDKNIWTLLTDTVHLQLQDPFITTIDQKLILGGVHVDFLGDGRVKWRTVFYRLDSLQEAVKIFEGPQGMKDLRLKQLSDGRILALTRPQGLKGGRGRIGAVIFDKLSDLTTQAVKAAPLLKNSFLRRKEWCGSNEIHQIKDKIFVLGHVACFDKEKNRHYYAMAFELSDDFSEILNPQIIAERRDFLESKAKRPDLIDVVFGGGLVLDGAKARLYAGVSDAGAQILTIKNPFENIVDKS